MLFTPFILSYISTWSKEHNIDVDVMISFESGKIALIFKFANQKMARVWNKRYEAEYLNSCKLTLLELVKQTLKEAEGVKLYSKIC